VLQCAASSFPGFAGFLPLKVESETLHVALPVGLPDQCILWAMELLKLLLTRPIKVTLCPDDVFHHARQRMMPLIQQFAGSARPPDSVSRPESSVPDDSSSASPTPPLLKLLGMILLLSAKDGASLVLFWPAIGDVRIAVQGHFEGFVCEMIPPPAALGRGLIPFLKMNMNSGGWLPWEVQGFKCAVTFHRSLYGEAAIVRFV
jgi:hypothetical protein